MKWTPNDKPITKHIKINHLSPLRESKFSTHFNPSQKSNDNIIVAIAYTSASTALNQKLSVNVNVKQPKIELPNILIASFTVMKLFSDPTCCFTRWEIDQNKNSSVNALDVTDIMFTVSAIWSDSNAKVEKIAPSIWKSGAPGGWPTCNLAEVEIYSAQSQ